MGEKAGGSKGMVVLLAVLGMVCWGLAPIFAKIGLKDVNPMLGLGIRTLMAGGLVAVWMSASGMFADIGTVSASTWIFIAIEAVLATLVGDLAYFAAIKSGDVSVVTIIMASSPVVTILCAAIFLGDKITFEKIIGAALVIGGIAMII